MMNIKWLYGANQFIETEVTDIKVKNNLMEMVLKVNYSAFENILKNNFFHLSKDVIENQSRKIFSEDKVIEMDVRLAPKIFETLKDKIELSKESLSDYLANNNDAVLGNEASWYVLNVKQEEELPPELKDLGTVKTGFSTIWNKKL